MSLVLFLDPLKSEGVSPADGLYTSLKHHRPFLLLAASLTDADISFSLISLSGRGFLWDSSLHLFFGRVPIGSTHLFDPFKASKAQAQPKLPGSAFSSARASEPGLQWQRAVALLEVMARRELAPKLRWEVGGTGDGVPPDSVTWWRWSPVFAFCATFAAHTRGKTPWKVGHFSSEPRRCSRAFAPLALHASPRGVTIDLLPATPLASNSLFGVGRAEKRAEELFCPPHGARKMSQAKRVCPLFWGPLKKPKRCWIVVFQVFRIEQWRTGHM